MKTVDDVIKEIDPTQWYRPSQISDNMWMVGFQGKRSYFYILQLIKLNRLKAKNFGKGKTSYFRILGSDLIRYLETLK